MHRRRLTAALAVALALAGTACSPSTVRLAYAPAVGDVRSYRYEVHATVTQALEGTEPVRNEVTAVLEVDEEILDAHAGGALAQLIVRRDGGEPRTVEVRLDRSGSLAGIDLVDGEDTPSVDLGVLQGVLASLALPERPLSPGDEWTVDEGPLVGHGRLRRLAVVDGDDAAVVRTTAEQAVDEQIPSGGTVAHLTGDLSSSATTTYALDGGVVLRSRVRAGGVVSVVVDPPPGVEASPVQGEITYRVDVAVTRVG